MGIYADRGIPFESAKGACAIEIEQWYGGKALDVFDSSATGVLRRYYCAEPDQLRMINGKVSNTSVSLMCGVVPADPDTDPAYEWVLHTSTEAGKVHTDYVQFTKEIAVQYLAFKAQLAATTTLEQVDALFYLLWPRV